MTVSDYIRRDYNAAGLIPRTAMYTVILLLCLFLMACETQPVKTVQLKRGMDFSELVAAWGHPHAQEPLSAQEVINYKWRLSEMRLEPARRQNSPSVSPGGGISSGGAVFSSGNVRRIYCDISVLVDSQNRVIDWETSGSGCRQILLQQI